MQLLYRLRYLLALLTIVAGLALYPGVERACEVDNSLDIWFMKDDPALIKYKNFQKNFGNDEVITLVVHDKNGLLNEYYLKAFRSLSKELSASKEVESILGPGNAPIVQKDFIGYFASPLINENTTPEELKRTLERNSFLKSQLFTDDYTTARFLIVPKQISDFDNKRMEILDQITVVIHKHLADNKFYLGGIGIIYSGLNKLSQQDFGFFLGAGYLIMFIVLLMIHRSVLTMVYALGTVALATYFTLGIYGYCGYRLNLMTVLLPIIFILLGIMDVMHIINEYALLKEGSPQTRAHNALRGIFKPCLFTSLTTIAGFLVSLSSPMPILSNFGLFAALGILFCLIFTYLLGILILPYCKPHTYTTTFTAKQAINLLNFVIRNKRTFSVLTLGIVLVLSAGMKNLRADTYTLGYFPGNNKVVTDHEAIQKYWGAYLPLELVVKAKFSQYINKPPLLKAASDFSASLIHFPGLGSITGYHSFYNSFLNLQYKEKASQMQNSPVAISAADKAFKLYFPAIAGQYISADKSEGRITISGEMVSARHLSDKTDSILKLSSNHFGEIASVEAAGYQPLYANIVKYVTNSQISSFILSLALVFLLMLIYIRDIKLSVLALIPNLSPIAIMFGVMGWFGITMDTATASIASIVLGIAIDDTIHYIYHYKKLKKSGLDPEVARLKTTAHVVPAIILTGLMLTGGYSFMLLASLKTVMLFGLLTAIAILSGLFSELIMFPLLLQRFDRN